MAKKIRLNNGEDVIVDDEDFNRLNQYTWSLTSGRPSRRYFDTSENKYAIQMMSREVHRLKAGAPATVRYVDKNGLNNQKENLKVFEGRKSIIIEKSSRGFLWPRKLDAFKTFIEQRDDLKTLSIDKLAVLDMVDTAHDVKWTFRKIELIYELDTEEYEEAKRFKPYFLRVLSYYWDWKYKFIISATSLVEEEDESEDVEYEVVEADEVEADEVEADEVEADEVEADEVESEEEEYEVEEVDEVEEVEDEVGSEIKIIPRAALSREVYLAPNLGEVKLEDLIFEIKRRGLVGSINF